MPLDRSPAWSSPLRGRRIRTIESHTGGEPFRIVVDGIPDIPGDTMLAKRRWAMDHLDDVRRALMWEPRGHADMYGCFLTDAVSDEADFGILFVHNEGFSTMCGHGIIAITSVAVDTGMLPGSGASRSVVIDTPAGVVRATASVDDDGTVSSVSFENVPSFVVALDQIVEVPGLGAVRVDVAFGGAFYAYVDAADVGLDLTPAGVRPIIDAGRAIKAAVSETIALSHPDGDDMAFLYGVIFVGPPGDPANHSRNVCVFADGEVDRSPTGTGVSGRAALHHARGELALGDVIAIESIVGSRFDVSARREEGRAIVPVVSGTAAIVGRGEFVVGGDDAFLIR